MEEEGKRKKVEGQMETQGVELGGVRAKLAATQAEVARLTVESSKYREDTLMEVSRLHARAEAAERKATKAIDKVAGAKAVALSDYQSSAKFEQVCKENYDKGVLAFMYNV